jgi:hypothetical protein
MLETPAQFFSPLDKRPGERRIQYKVLFSVCYLTVNIEDALLARLRRMLLTDAWRKFAFYQQIRK